MGAFFTDDDWRVLAAAADLVIPPDPLTGAPGGATGGVVHYLDQLLGAFIYDPPRIWAGGPFSGRHGGDASFGNWFALRPVDELAWRTRVEGSLGRSEREVNGPTVGLQEHYRAGLASLGPDFADLSLEQQQERLHAVPDGFRDRLYAHACEALYGDPVYGGNRQGSGWASIGFPGDVQPRGYTDDEVRGDP